MFGRSNLESNICLYIYNSSKYIITMIFICMSSLGIRSYVDRLKEIPHVEKKNLGISRNYLTSDKVW